MANNRIFNLPETKGAFQIRGVVNGTQKENFCKEIKTTNNNDMKIVNFGLEYSNKKTLYLNVLGIAGNDVYFSKRADKEGEKPITERVSWSNRFSFNKKDFKLIGNNIGITKIVDENGKTVNDKKILTDYDTCCELKKNLKDSCSVFTRGKIDYSSFSDNNGNKKNSIKLIPTQISLCQDVEFNEEYEELNDFNQVIVFMGIDQEKQDNKPTGRYVVDARIVTYKTIENAEFYIENSNLANLFRKKLKPYTAIKVSGRIVSNTSVETVVDEDSWGETDNMEKVFAPTKREFIITGAKPSTIDSTIYTQEKMEEAMMAIANANRAEEDFNAGSDNDDTDDWGSVSDNDEDEAW